MLGKMTLTLDKSQSCITLVQATYWMEDVSCGNWWSRLSSSRSTDTVHWPST